MAQAFPVAVVLVAALVSAAIDVWKFKVHNVLTVPLLISGLVYHAVVGGAAGLAGSALGVGFGFGILLMFYVMGGMGAGDVKLLAAIGAWLGVGATFWVFIASSLAAGVYAVVLVLVGGRLAETWVNLQIVVHRISAVGRYLGDDGRVEREVKRGDRRGRIIPFAAMVAIGLLATLVWSWKMGVR